MGEKYDADGVDGLTDKRGRHKTDDEVDEIERLQHSSESHTGKTDVTAPVSCVFSM